MMACTKPIILCGRDGTILVAVATTKCMCTTTCTYVHVHMYIHVYTCIYMCICWHINYVILF